MELNKVSFLDEVKNLMALSTSSAKNPDSDWRRFFGHRPRWTQHDSVNYFMLPVISPFGNSHLRDGEANRKACLQSCTIHR